MVRREPTEKRRPDEDGDDWEDEDVMLVLDQYAATFSMLFKKHRALTLSYLFLVGILSIGFLFIRSRDLETTTVCLRHGEVIPCDQAALQVVHPGLAGLNYTMPNFSLEGAP